MAKKIVWCGSALACLAVVFAPGIAQAQTCGPLNNGRVADAFYEGTVVSFQPVVEFQEMRLTISGPCEDIVKVFGPKDQISFDIREIERVQDGQYTWRLSRTATVDPGVQKELLQARGTGEEDTLWWSFFQKGLIPDGPYVDSGSFTVERGLIVDPNSGEEKRASLAGKGVRGGASSAIQGALAGGLAADGPSGEGGDPVLSTKDTVLTNADGVIRNSLCVGFDCLNNNTYSDTTIMLTENNTRIKFDDTSSVNSFPRNDWEIEANSNLNGGQSYLGFNDCGQSSGGGCASDLVFAVEAGVRQNALYVESDGDVGLGTSNPVVRLHVTDGDSPALRLEQDGSSGFQPQVWDVAGNETNFFVRDATGGSTLPFRIQPGGAPSSSIHIRNSGNVGMGTSSPSEKLDLHVAGAVRIQLSNTSAGSDWNFANDANGDFAVSRVGSGGNDFEIEQDGDMGNCGNPDHDFVISTGPGCAATPRSWIDAGDAGFSTTSSRTLKEHLVPLAAEGIVEKLSSIPVYRFDFIDGPKERIGLMAEDFHTIFGRGSDKEISSHEMQLAMWLAIQELSTENRNLKDEVKAKDGALEVLEDRLDRVEAALSAAVD